MELFVQAEGIRFVGQVKDLIEIFSGYPPETTLRELIRLHLN